MVSVISTVERSFLTADEIVRFHREGYFIKRQSLDTESIKKLAAIALDMIREINQEITSEKYPCSPLDQITHIRGTQVVFKKYSVDKISILRVVGCGGMENQLLEILRSDKIARTFFQLLGCDAIEHIICQLHPKQTHDGSEFPKHRDQTFRRLFDPNWKDVLGNGSYAVCIIPVDPMTAENGGLFVDKNSYPESVDWVPDVVALEMEPGDMLFMHPAILHWSGPNTSTTPRKTFLTGFAAEGANHKTYPGAEINTLLKNTPDGITAEHIEREAVDFSFLVGKH